MRELSDAERFFLGFIKKQIQEANNVTRKQRTDLRMRYLEQLPMIAAMLMEEDPKEAVSEAMELLDECANALETAVDDE